MSAIVRARLLSNILRKINNRRFLVTVNPPKEPIVSSSSIINKQAPPPPPQLTDGAEMKPWDFLKYGLIASLTGGLATAGYATYAYSLDKIDEKTKAFRASANYAIQDDASASDIERKESKRIIIGI